MMNQMPMIFPNNEIGNLIIRINNLENQLIKLESKVNNLEKKLGSYNQPISINNNYTNDNYII